MSDLTECPVDEMVAFLDEQLDSAAHDRLIDHLDHCEACRQRIDTLAADPDSWQLAQEALSTVGGSRVGGELSFGKLYDSNAATNSIANADSVGEVQSIGRIDPASLLQVLSPSDDPRAAGRIGPFEILGIVGSGGMGIVLKARDPALDRFVAIKMLAPHLASSKSARRRFAREARAAAAVIHENVIEIYQVAHWNDLPYLVMPYLPDPSLGQRLEEHGALDVESILSIALQLARGLASAHSQGLVHRDVKPANVLLCKGTERAIITDFGLARASDDASLTRAGTLAGTPHYMSPEQARGESVEGRSDLFSLGSVVYAMTTGRPPIDLELGSETISRIATGEMPSLATHSGKVPAWLVRLVDWLHESDQAKRPESAEQVADLLEQCLAWYRQPEKFSLPSVLVTPKESPNRKRTALALAGVALLGLIALSPWLVDRSVTSPPHQESSQNENAIEIESPHPQSEAGLQSASGSSEWGTAEEIDGLVAEAEEFMAHSQAVWELNPMTDWSPAVSEPASSDESNTPQDAQPADGSANEPPLENETSNGI